MKKLFVSILALAAFAACQSNFNEVDYNTPEFGGVVNVGGSHTIYAEVGVGEETKATYGDDLSALWEEGDQIALLQEHADYGKTFGVENKIGIKNGAGTSFASFSGDISVDSTDPRVYHIAYPASAASYTVSMSQSVVVTKYDSNVDWEVSGNMGQSTGYATCTYNSTVNVTVPTSQSGKWEPYMYASTSEAVASNAIGAKTLTTLTGAIAIRAVKPDGVTPLQLKAVAVSATKPIAGAFSGSAQSVGDTQTVTGAKTEGTYNSSNREAEALANLTSALQSYEATTTSVTKALSLSFVGEEYTVKADDTTWVAADENGVYTYHLNVAPFEGADLTITATAVDGSTLVRTISGQSLAAAHRKGYNFKWETAAFGYEAIHTWYDNYQNSPFTLASNTIHVGGVKVTGSVTEQNVTAIGVRIYNEADESLYTEVVESNKLSFATNVSGIPSGRYIVKVFADIVVNGVATTKEFSETKIVTAIPEIAEDYSYIRSSYSYNGGVNLDNSVGGGDLRVKTVLNDSYLAANLVQSYTFYYNGNSVNPTLGQEHNIPLGYQQWGQYDCYVKLVLGNGYVIEGQKHAAHVTGIPFTMTTSSNADGWSISGPSDWNKNGGFRMGYGVEHASTAATSATKGFYMPANTLVKMYVRGKVETTANSSNTFSAKVSGGTVAEAKAESSSWIKGATTEFELKDKVGTITNADPTISLRNASATSSRATYIYEMKLEYHY